MSETTVEVLDATETRCQRGMSIAALSKIAYQDGSWLVPCQGKDGHYTVNLSPPSPSVPMCTCADYEERGEPCKHVFAVRFVVQRDTHEDGGVTLTKMMTITEQTVIPRAYASLFSGIWARTFNK